MGMNGWLKWLRSLLQMGWMDWRFGCGTSLSCRSAWQAAQSARYWSQRRTEAVVQLPFLAKLQFRRNGVRVRKWGRTRGRRWSGIGIWFSFSLRRQCRYTP